MKNSFLSSIKDLACACTRTHFLKFVRIFALSIGCILIIDLAQAQSIRRTTTRSEDQIRNRGLRVKFEEMDTRLGKVLLVKGDKVFVDMPQNTQMHSGWEKQYYVCDQRMTTVAILFPSSISHRNCYMFLTVEGSVAAGDSVFLKQIPPQDPDETALNAPEN